MKKYKVVSLYSGAGGFDLGFLNTGNFETVWAIDFNKDACDTYKYNIGDHIINGDINNIDLNSIPDCDIIIGGSPCQGFSGANSKNRAKSTTSFLHNPKNFLALKYIEVVKQKRPKMFVLENVPGILTAGNGQFVSEIKKELSDYNITIKVMNMSKYGVPQMRKRAIIIGSLYENVNHPVESNDFTKVKDALCGINDDTVNQNNRIYSKQETIKKIKQVPQGGSSKNVEELKNKKMHGHMYNRLHENKQSCTIVHAAKAVIIHPTEDRIISVREAARIQTFPDTFIFKGSTSSMYQQVANAVPPVFAEKIAECAFEHLEKFS